MAKVRMPRTRAEFEEQLVNAFMAGCVHGYAVEHTQDMHEQEMAGALRYIGKITKEEFDKRMNEYQRGWSR